MATPSNAGAVSGLSLIVLCFLASAALRIAESGAAFAEEFATVAAESDAAEGEGLLAAIREREAQLDAEAKRLSDRQQTLNVAEAKLAEQLAAFETAQRQLEETMALADNAAERDIDTMTAVYENMKPADAARIFGEMDVTFAAGLLSRLRPETAAAVLTGMEPAAAYAVTLMIASRNANVPTE